MRRFWRALVAVLVVMMSPASPLHAAVPAREFAYTRQTNLAPGAYKFVFSLYDSPTAATPLWASGTVSLTLKTPLLVYNLGSGSVKIPASIDFTQQLFLRVVKTSPAPSAVIANRVRLPIVPYALNAETLGGHRLADLSIPPIWAASPLQTTFAATYVDCVTPAYTPTVDERVTASSVSSIVGNVSGTVIYASNVYSTDGGVTWLVQSLEGQFMRMTTVATAWVALPNVSYLNLTAGSTYQFGIRYTRESGAATIADGRCEILVAPYARL